MGYREISIIIKLEKEGKKRERRPAKRGYAI